MLIGLSAQNKSEPADSLVRLMSAQSAQMMKTDDGKDVRKVIGPARFLHNNTYLICDTALWHVETRVINAFGHVKILQDETVLTSEKLDYYIDDDLAQFRGSVVQLQDKDRNTLRTRYLDYNTKDSVATFFRGASMKDRDGQIIESEQGSYDSKVKLFTFERNVNMFADSVFINSYRLIFHGDTQLAEFDKGVDAWKDKDMLSAEQGYYDRSEEVFRFYGNVHGMSEAQEGWADTLFFHKLTQDLEMYGNVQLRDTTRGVSAMAETLFYVDSTATLTMQTNATLVAEVEDSTATEDSARDTIYVGADRVVYWTMRKCDIDNAEFAASEKRLSDIALDPVAEYRKRAAEAAEQAAADAKRKREEEMGRKPSANSSEAEPEPESESEPEQPEVTEPENGSETAPETVPEESAEPQTEELAQEPAEQENEMPEAGPEAGVEPAGGEEPTEESLAPGDTTKIGFMRVTGNVRVFKSDMQARCDSLAYTELDSLARLYLDPIVWNEANRQYSADSIAILSENSRMRKADLMSNAFITIQEDTVCFDQIRGTEMLAFFDSTSVLERFDALGGASAVFFLEENETLATVNKVESKMLTANFVSGEIDKIYYYDGPHNDAYPTVQLPSDDRRMKGFRWNPEMRPTCMEDVTPYRVRPLERGKYSTRLRPEFPRTDVYFPGYMNSVYASIAQKDSARAADKARRAAEKELADQLAALDEENGIVAEETVEEPAEAAPEENPAENAESAGTPQNEVPAPQEEAENPNEVEVDLKDLPELLKAQKEAEREAAAAEKQAKKEAKWAELDARDAAKEAEKAERQKRKMEKKAAKIARLEAKETAREQKLFDRYEKRFKKQKRAQVFKAIKKSGRTEQ